MTCEKALERKHTILIPIPLPSVPGIIDSCICFVSYKRKRLPQQMMTYTIEMYYSHSTSNG